MLISVVLLNVGVLGNVLMLFLMNVVCVLKFVVLMFECVSVSIGVDGLMVVNC